MTQCQENKKELNRSQLLIKYNISCVQKGTYENGFIDCLRNIDNRNIDLFNNLHTIKVIQFANERNLSYSWLLNQLRSDYKKRKLWKEYLK